jgi:crotonobetainyl-CoA:carnitine CoA-transferase CaiB-like acyl-CoA transferase
VLELPGADIALCGKMVADLGAQVIKIEPPGGDPGRRVPPLFRGKDGSESSVHWRAYNRGKQSVTLDLERAEGRALFRTLAQRADLVIEGFTPGTLERLELGYEALQRLNAALILVSVTPFGQTGPYARYQATDIVPLALGGYLFMTGERGGPPLRIGVPQTFLHACGAGAVGGMLALHQRHRTGRGQHVDASAQHAQLALNGAPFSSWDYNRELLQREGQWRMRGPVRTRIVFEAQDGYVACLAYPGHLGGKAAQKLVERMRSEGFPTASAEQVDWLTDFFATAPQELVNGSFADLSRYFAAKSKAELFALAQEFDLMLAPVETVEDLFRDEQFAARGFWETAEGDADGLKYPGPAVRMSRTPWVHGAAAPALGEHNAAVYGELAGLDAAELERLRAVGCV